MNPYYKRLLEEFSLVNNLENAIINHNDRVYYYLMQLVIMESDVYRNIKKSNGSEIADNILMDSLIVFHRQVKHNKIEIKLHNWQFKVNNRKTELISYLVNLYSLIFETSSFYPAYTKNLKFEMNLKSGQGFEKIYDLKNQVISALHSYGCRDNHDKDEIFHQCLLVFWKKLLQEEIGVFFPGNNQRIELCRVFNRKFYQNSNLKTYLIGIAKNVFSNKIKYLNKEKFIQITSEENRIFDSSSYDQGSDNTIFLIFLYYREYVEKRKLRTLISLLQYDCNLDENEIRFLLGINNARIHSCRLRSHFNEWYHQNQHCITEILDHSNNYFVQRETKKERMNIKIQVIDRYQRKTIFVPDLSAFQSEFRSINEFKNSHLIFKNIYYLTVTGKPSSLTGIPDEKIFKSILSILY